DRESEAARRAGRETSPDLLSHFATALAADGSWRVPDPASDRGMRWRFDLAVELFEHLMARRDAPPGTRVRLYETLVRYGDFLVSLDRPVMARFAYERAFELTNNDPNQMGGQHLAW